MSAARLVKTVDELSCLRHAMWITEQAMAEVQAGLRPGARQVDLTATLLHRVFELGAEANALDPIWQVMPNHQAELPLTVPEIGRATCRERGCQYVSIRGVDGSFTQKKSI